MKFVNEKSEDIAYFSLKSKFLTKYFGLQVKPIKKIMLIAAVLFNSVNLAMLL